MRITKIFAVVMSVLMMLALFTACEEEKTPAELEAVAAQKLLEEPCAITTEMNYSCDDEQMNAVFEEMSGMEMTVYMDGTNFAMDMELYGEKVGYVYVDNTMYIDVMGMKMRMALTAEQAMEMMGSGSTEMTAGSVNSFKEVTVVLNDDGSTTITCKGLSDDDNAMIDSMMGELGSTEGVEASVDAENMTLVIVIDKDGFYKSMDVDMAMTLDIEDYGVVNVDADMTMTYDFEAGKEITAPEDADSYEQVDADDFLG
ncbi:MAG: hypothetical protein IJY39_08475 [Clostridia bacterium]|nr:hypothetical protein [Clostridia bacterium]